MISDPEQTQPSLGAPTSVDRVKPHATESANRSLHTALRDARKDAKMTQRQAAAVLGVQQSLVAKSERAPTRGGRRVSAVELPMFAACYGTTMETLLQSVRSDERATVTHRAQDQSRMSRRALWAKGALLRPRPIWGRSRCAWAPLGWAPVLESPDASLVALRRKVSDFISGNYGFTVSTLIHETPTLLEMFSEYGERPLFEAARKESFDAAKVLLDAGADPDLPQNWSHPYAWAQTARQAVDRSEPTVQRVYLLKAMGGRRASEGRLPWGGFNRVKWNQDILLDLCDGPHQQLEFAFSRITPEYFLRTKIRP